MINALNKQVFFRLKLISSWDKPENFTGIIENPIGTKRWYLNEFLHGTNGPAVEYIGGFKHWFLDGISYSKEEWYEEIKKRIEKINYD